MARISKILPSVGVLALLLGGGVASAQEADDGDTGEEIVVTGTSIRGVAPVGAESVGLGAEEIQSSNATSTVDLLTNIPQISGFNSLAFVLPVGNQQTSNLPAIRGLRSTQSGSSPTLLLVDGHRVSGAGVTQTIADPDVVPPGAIERVEVVTDGGSSVYGADAVGGVINLITRRDFDGVEVRATQGFGDEYQSTIVDFTAGHKWSTGDAYITYEYAQHDAIYGSDRDYVRDIFYDTETPSQIPFLGLGTNRYCGEGNLTVGGANYQIINGHPDTTPATNAQIQCDASQFRTIYPQERRDSVFAAMNQDLNEWLTFDVRAYFTQRTTKSDLGLQGTFTTVNNQNDYFEAINSQNETQTVYYNFADIPGRSSTNRVELQTWGFSPQLTADLGHDWQGRAFFNYSLAQTASHSPIINGAALAANHDHINFYDIGATAPGILSSLVLGDPITGLGNDNYGHGENQIVNSRVVFDGPLFRLPAGQVRVALGAEYLGETFNNAQYNLADAEDSRRSHAVFAEANIPIVSPENNVPLIHELSLDLAGRHDTYSDFGSVTTPRVGVTYAPIDWVNLRGTYGQSFQAPSLANTADAGRSKFFSNGQLPTIALSPYLPAGTPNADGNHFIMAVDGALTLDAQRAETFSIGTDISPPIVPGLEMGVTYWHIDYAGIVDTPPFLSAGANGVFFTDPQYSQYREFANGASFTQQQVHDFLVGDGTPAHPGNGISQAQFDQYFIDNPATAGNINVLIDVRKRNLGAQRIAGFDGYVRYDHDTNFGSVYGSVNATYMAMNKLNAQGSAYSENNADDYVLGTRGTPRWGATTTVGFRVGDDFRAQASVQYSPSVHTTPSPANGEQFDLDAAYPLDLYAQYDGFGENLSVSLGLNNAFNQDPPHYNGVNQTTSGYVGGNLGRVFYIGFDKSF